MAPTNFPSHDHVKSIAQCNPPEVCPESILVQLWRRFARHDELGSTACAHDDRIVYVPEDKLRSALEFGMEPRDVREWVTERSAIAEFDGGRDRAEADAAAIAELQRDLSRRRHMRDHPQLELGFR